jgi:hypothetical protein
MVHAAPPLCNSRLPETLVLGKYIKALIREAVMKATIFVAALLLSSVLGALRSKVTN